MGKFDQYKVDKKEETPPPPPCDHKFKEDLELITEYDESFCELVIEFAREGNFIEGFCGQYNICSHTMNKIWLNREDPKYERFRSAIKTAQSVLFSFYNKELVHALKHYDTLGTKVGVLRSLLSDLMKYTPKAIRELQFEDIEPNEDPEAKKEREEKERKLREYNLFRPEKEPQN